MGILSKYLPMREISMPFNCYEVGHTWTPYCSAAAVGLGWSTFKQAIKLYAPLYLLTQAFQRKYNIDDFVKTFKSIFRSACFLGFNAFAFLAIFCSIRRAAGKFYYFLCAYFPAFVASALALLIEREGRRGALAVYVANIATETIFKMALSRGRIKSVPQGEIMIFCVSTAVFLYLIKLKGYTKDAVGIAFRFILGAEEAGTEKQSQLKNGHVSEASSENEKNERKPYVQQHTMVQQLRALLHKLNKELRHASCPHPSGCAIYVTKGAIRPFFVGWLGHVLFKVATSSRLWLQNPWVLAKYPTRGPSLRFGLFMSSLAGVYKLGCCLLRWFRGKDVAWHALPCGFLSGLTMFIYPNSTLALYFMWKVIEMVYCIGVKDGIVPLVQPTIVALYAASTALLFYAALLEPHNMRPSYLRFLSRVSERKFDQINRLVLDIFGTNASSMYRNFFPQLDPKFISRPFQETILVWL